MERTIERSRPARSEYAEFYEGYVSLVPAGDIIDILKGQRDEMVTLLASVPEDKVDYRSAPGKWSTRQIVGHVIDAE